MALASILKSVNKGLLKDILTGAGLSLATSGATLIALNQVIQHFRNTITGMPPLALSLAHLSGIDVAFSLILGAIVAKWTLSANNLTLQKIGQK